MVGVEMIGWLFLFWGGHGISTFTSYLMPNPFYTNNQFISKSLPWVHSLIVKNISILRYLV